MNNHFPGVLSDEYGQDPYKYIDLLDKTENVIYDKTLNAHLAISYDAVRSILGNSVLFSTKPLSKRAEPVMRGKVLAQMEGNEHKIKKSMLLHQLTGRVLKDYYHPKLTNLCDSLLTEIITKNKFDFISDFGNKYALLTTFNIIGIDYNKLDWYLERLKLIVQFATGFNLSKETEDIALFASEELEKVILDLIDERKKCAGDDIISFIIHNSNESEILSDSEIVALSLNILLAASEPVDKVLANCIYHLYRNESYIDLVISNDCSTNSILQESLRITPPVHLIPRQVEDDSCVEGVNLKKGDLIFSLIPSANRDEKYFEHPNTFNPRREFKGHLSYGVGIHACIGAQFANMQLNIALQKLVLILKNYKEITPPTFGGIYTRGATQYNLERV
ncbi:cytochrome P450 [Gilliamella sp. Choc5-1]|uniref:cytochrome P450 n=2 Tax=Gilliamella TaxID=1193503 RepID=UPI00159EF294|nr:cytochrome P450 [Gilliamella apicola]